MLLLERNKTYKSVKSFKPSRRLISETLKPLRLNVLNFKSPSGDNDLVDAITAAVINKRSGGMGLILGRKVF